MLIRDVSAGVPLVDVCCSVSLALHLDIRDGHSPCQDMMRGCAGALEG